MYPPREFSTDAEIQARPKRRHKALMVDQENEEITTQNLQTFVISAKILAHSLWFSKHFSRSKFSQQLFAGMPY